MVISEQIKEIRKSRADDAANAMKLGDYLEDVDISDSNSVCSILADIMYYCDEHELKFESLLKTAEWFFENKI